MPFWENDIKFHPDHPVHAEPAEVRSHTIPVGLHGDEVADVKDDKVLVITWSSVPAKSAAWDCRFVFAVVPHREMCGRETMWDIFRVLVWSLNVARTGVFPHTDHLGNRFPGNTLRGKLAGHPIAGFWRLAFAEMRGDNEFFAAAYAWNHYRCYGLNYIHHHRPERKGELDPPPRLQARC